MQNTQRKDDNLYSVSTKAIDGRVVFGDDYELERIHDLLKFYAHAHKKKVSFSEQNRYREIVKGERLVEVVEEHVSPSELKLVLKENQEHGISTFMSKVLNSYSRYYNIKHQRKDPLWEGVFNKSLSNPQHFPKSNGNGNGNDNRGFKALGIAILAATLLLGSHAAQAATLYWVGGNGDSYNNASDWNTTDPAVCLDNLGDGSVPGASDDIIFDADCDSNLLIDSDWTVNGITINAGYTGTITQNDATNWTVDSTTGFTANGGTYSPQGTTSTFTIGNVTGTMSIDTSSMAGAFNDVVINTFAGSVSIVSDMDVNGDITITAVSSISGQGINAAGNVTATDTSVGGSTVLLFDGAGNQTLQVDGAGGTAEMISISINKSGGTLTVNDNIQISPGSSATVWTYTAGTVDMGTSKIQFEGPQLGQTYTIDSGAMSFNDVEFLGGSNDAMSITGTMDVDGDLTITNISSINSGTIAVSGNVTTTDTSVNGSATILFDGGNNQTLQVDGAGGTAEIISISINKSGGTLTVKDNIQVSQSNTMTVWTYTAGTVDMGTSLIAFEGPTSGRTLTINSGVMSFNDVSFLSGASDTMSITGTMDVDGDLTITNISSIDSGTIAVSGNVTTTDTSVNGSATILFDGGNNQTLQVDGAGGTAEIISISINKSGGTLTVKDNIEVSPGNTMTVWTYTAGTVDMGTSLIKFEGPVSGRTFTINAGAMSFNDVTFSGTSDGMTITGTLDINGDMVITPIVNLNSGSITVAGNVTSSDTGITGTATLTLDGIGAQSIIVSVANAEFTGAGIIINKASGTATVTTNPLVINDAGEDLTIQEGTLDLNGFDLTVNDVFNVEDGGNLQLQGSETITGGPDSLASGSTVTYNDTAGTETIKDYSYHHLTINGSGGTFNLPALTDSSLAGNLTITAGTLDLSGNDITVAGTFSNLGTIRLEGGETTVSLTMDADSGTAEYDGGGSYTGLKLGNTYNNLTISGAGTWDLNNDLDIDGNFVLSAGTLDVTTAACDGATNPCDITLEGNWTNSGGTFTERTGTVTLDGTNHTFQGSEGFYNLSKAESNNNATDEVLTFDDAQTITVSGTWTLDGRDSDDQINLVSDNPGTQWNVSPTGTRTLDWIDVTDSNNTSGTDILCVDNCTVDSQNNTNWTSDSTNPGVSTLFPADEGSAIAVDGNLIITFDEAVDVETGNITIFKTSDDSIVEVIDVTSGQVTGTGTTTITINPTSNLDDSTDYYIQIDASGFDDPSSNSFPGISDKTTWNFSTQITLDNNVFDLSLEVLTGNSATLGDILEGKLLITNNKNTSISNTNIHLTLPNGMTYLKDSVQSTDSMTIDSITQNPNEIVININSISSGLTLEPITFKLMIGTNTSPGESLNIGAYTDNV